MNKSIRFIISLAILFFMATSCNRNSPVPDDKKQAEKQNDARFTDKETEKDAKYLVDAYGAGLVEINFSKKALEISTNQDVKNFAQMMVSDHTSMGSDVEALASKKQVTLPQEMTESQTKDLNSMAEKNGRDFDKAYIDKMVSDHKDAVSLFRDASGNASDNDVRNLFSTGLPKIQAHLDRAQTIQDQIK
jgi:putative membrane protein